MNDELHTRDSLARELKVSKRTVDSWFRRGVKGVILAKKSVGGRVRIAWLDYLAFQREIDRRKALTSE